MRKNNVVIEDAPAAPAITPDMLGKLKKEDMKQAIAERFKATSEAPRTAGKERKRSPYWQPADEEC
jgi:hypothetical protein